MGKLRALEPAGAMKMAGPMDSYHHNMTAYAARDKPPTELPKSLLAQAQLVVERLGKLQAELEHLNERLHGRLAAVAKASSPLTGSGEPPLRLTLERASALLSDCENELAEALQRL